MFARKPQQSLAYGIDNLERCFEGLPDHVVRTVHMCCGYPNALDAEGYLKAEQDAYLQIADAMDASSVNAVSIEDAHRHNDFIIAGSDQFGDMYTPAGNMSLMMEIDDLSDAQAKFTALSEAGQIIMPFAETFWADGYGFCTDRFGIMWQINCTGSKAM